MNFACPSCNSDNIQRLSVVYEGGLSAINTKSKGTAVGFGRDGISVGVGGGGTKGTSQTAQSKRAAPPPKRRYVKPLLGIGVAFFAVALFVQPPNIVVQYLYQASWLAASVAWIGYAFQYNARQWPALKAQWDQSYLCNRCSQIFSLAGA